jgi:hypothetical protein
MGFSSTFAVLVLIDMGERLGYKVFMSISNLLQIKYIYIYTYLYIADLTRDYAVISNVTFYLLSSLTVVERW